VIKNTVKRDGSLDDLLGIHVLGRKTTKPTTRLDLGDGLGDQ
jgi:hypothetical protein